MMKKRMTAGLFAALLAVAGIGCGQGNGADQDTQSGGKYPNGKLNVYNWGEYIDEALIEEFESQYGIDVIYDTFTTNEEMYPKIQANPGMYDVICPSDYMIEKMMQNDLLQAVDWDQIPNAKNIGETYMERVADFDPGNLYAVPYCWGTVGILYNTAMVDEPVNSWDILWDEKYENNIIMQDSVRDAFMVALKRLGFSSNTTDTDQLEQAMESLKEQNPLVKAYAIDEVRDKMINDTAALGVIYSGEYLYCKEQNENLAYVVPEEGSNLWFDGWVITKDSANVENAHKWLDFMCDAEVAKANFDYITYATPNEAAMELIDQEIVEDPAVFADEDVIERCEVFHYLGEEAEDMYYEYWKQVK